MPPAPAHSDFHRLPPPSPPSAASSLLPLVAPFDPAFKLFGQTIPVSSTKSDDDERSATTTDSHSSQHEAVEEEDMDVDVADKTGMRDSTVMNIVTTLPITTTSASVTTALQVLEDERMVPASTRKCDASSRSNGEVDNSDGGEDSVPTSTICMVDNNYAEETTADKIEGVCAEKQTAEGTSVVDKEEELNCKEEEEEEGAEKLGVVGDGQPALMKPDKPIPCPRCESMDTKFCYYNNYNVNQPRHFCKGCQRYWTAGGTLRNVPVGAGRRKSKQHSSSTSATCSKSAAASSVRCPDDPAAVAASRLSSTNGIAKSRGVHDELHDPEDEHASFRAPSRSSDIAAISIPNSRSYDMNRIGRAAADPSSLGYPQPPPFPYSPSRSRACLLTNNGGAHSSPICSVDPPASSSTEVTNDPAAAVGIGRVGENVQKINVTWQRGASPDAAETRDGQSRLGKFADKVKMTAPDRASIDEVTVKSNINNIVSCNNTASNTYNSNLRLSPAGADTLLRRPDDAAAAAAVAAAQSNANASSASTAMAAEHDNLRTFNTSGVGTNVNVTAAPVPPPPYAWNAPISSTNSPLPFVVNNCPTTGAWAPIYGSTTAGPWSAPPLQDAASLANYINVAAANSIGSGQFLPSSLYNSWPLGMALPPWQLVQGAMWPIPYCTAMWAMQWAAAVASASELTTTTPAVGGIQSPVSQEQQSGIKHSAKRSREEEVQMNGGDDGDESERATLLVPKSLRIGDPEAVARSSIWAAIGQRSADAAAADCSGSGGGGGGCRMFGDLLTTASDTELEIDGGACMQHTTANPAAASRSCAFHERNLVSN